MTEAPDPSRSPPPAAPHAAKRSHRDLIAGLTSGFVGALALATSLYNVYLQREQVRAQVWPKITLQDAKGDGDDYGISIANRGVGPADIQRMRVFVDGAPMKSWVEAFKTLRHAQSIPAPSAKEIVTTIANGQELLFISYPLKEWLEVVQERDRVALELCYCSTLRDCWSISGRWDGTPDVTAQVDECKPDPVPFSPYTHSESAQLLRGTYLALQADGGSESAVPDGGTVKGARNAH